MRLTIRYFAAARAAAGVDSIDMETSPSTTLGELEHILAADNPALARVLARCSYLRDEIALSDRTRHLGTCHTVDVLPPFAGG